MAKAKSRQVQRARARSAARRVDPEQRNRVYLIGGVVAAIILAVGFIGFGWYQTQIRPKGKVVLEVNETKFTLGHLERRMGLFLEQNANLIQSPQILASVPDQVLAELENEAKLLTSAKDLKIEVTEKDIDTEIAAQASVAADASPEAFANAYRDLVRDSGLHTSEYRQMIKAQVLQRRVTEYFTFVAPASEPQVRARWIQAASADDADNVVSRLKAGEDFAGVAREVSQDTASKEQGGEVDWRPRGGFPDEKIEDFLFTAQLGQRSDPIETRSGVYVVELLEKDENHQLDEQQKQLVVSRLTRDWLDGLTAKLTIEKKLSDSDRRHALDAVI